MGFFTQLKKKWVSLFTPKNTPSLSPHDNNEHGGGKGEGATESVNVGDNSGVPRKADGDLYEYEMVCDGGLTRVYGDTPEDMLAYLIEDYQNKTPKEKVMARIRHSMEIKISLQVHINHYFRKVSKNKAEQIILYNPQKQQPLIAEWVSEIPLVLVDSFYQPYSHVKKPVGLEEPHENIWWLNPTKDELEYLISLHETSYLDLYQKQPTKH